MRFCFWFRLLINASDSTRLKRLGGGAWWGVGINCSEKRENKRRAGGAGREPSQRLVELMYGRTGKRWSGALPLARGQSNKRAAVKNQYLLINSPTLWACKSQWNNVWVGSLPFPRSIALSKPKNLTGRDGIRVESWTGPKLQKGRWFWQWPAAAMLDWGGNALHAASRCT